MNKQRFKICFDKLVPKYTSFVTLFKRELQTFQHFCDQYTNLEALVSEPIEQYPSKEAVLISYNGWMWKFPAREKDRTRLGLLHTKYTINVTRWKAVTTDTALFCGAGGWFYYPKIAHKPMIPSEAMECVGELMKQLCSALEDMHKEHFVHLDVSLENICFDHEGKLVLIDMDRCTRIDDVCDGDITESSCMYPVVESELDVVRIDWRQVGLVLLWIYGWEDQIMKKKTYHTQDIAIVNHPIVNDKFFLDLMEGTTFVLCVFTILIVCFQSF